MDRLNQLRQAANDSASESLLDNSLASSDSNLGYQTANESSSSKYFSFIEDDSPSIKGILDGSDSTETLIDSDKIVEDIQDNVLSNLPPIIKKPDLLSYKIDNQIDAANILSGGVEIFDENENSYDENELIIDDNPSSLAENQPDDNKIVEDSSVENFKSGLLTKKTSEENPECKSTVTEEEVLNNTINKGTETCPEPNVITAEFTNTPDVQTSTNEIILQIDGKNLDAIDIGNGLFLYRKDGEEELTAIQITPSDDGSPHIKFLKVRHNEDDNLEVYEEQITEVPIINEKNEKETVVANDEVAVEPKASHLPIKDLNKVIGCADIMTGSKTVALEKRPNASSFDKIIVLPDEFEGKRDKKQANELESSLKDPKSHVSDKTEHIFATGLKMNDLNFTKTSQLTKAKAEIGIVTKTDLFKVEKSSIEPNVKITVSTEADKKLPSIWTNPLPSDQTKFKTTLDIKDKESSIFELCKKKSLETDVDKDLIEESFFDSLNDSVDLEESAVKNKPSRSPNILDCCIEKVKVLPVSPLRLPAPLISSSPITKTETFHEKAKTNKAGNICCMESFIPKLAPCKDYIENILDQLPTKEPKTSTEPVSKSITDFKLNETRDMSSDMVKEQSKGEICKVNIHTENTISRSNDVATKKNHCEASNKIIGNELSTIFVTGKLDMDGETPEVKKKELKQRQLDKMDSHKGTKSNLEPIPLVSNSNKQEKISDVKKLNKPDKIEDFKLQKVKNSTRLPVKQSDKAYTSNKKVENLPKTSDNDNITPIQVLCINHSKSESCKGPAKSNVEMMKKRSRTLKFGESGNKEVNRASNDTYNAATIGEIIKEKSVKNPSKTVTEVDKVIDLTDDTHLVDSEVYRDDEKPETQIKDTNLKLSKVAKSKPAAVEKLITSKQDIFKYKFGKMGDSKITPEDNGQIVNLSLEKHNLEHPFHFNKKDTTLTKKSESKLERLLRPETGKGTLESYTKNKPNDNHDLEKSNFSRIGYYQKVSDMSPSKSKGANIKETVVVDLIKASKEKSKSNPPLQLSMNEKPIGGQSALQLAKKVESTKTVKEVISKTNQPEQSGNDEDKFVYDDNYITEALNMKSINADTDYNEFATRANVMPSTALGKLKDLFAEERKINNKKQEITDVYKNLTGSKYPSNIAGKISSHTPVSSGIGKDFRKTQPNNWFVPTNKLNVPHPIPLDITIGNIVKQKQTVDKTTEDKLSKPIKETEVIILDDDCERYSEDEVLECEPVTGDVDFKWLQSVADVTKEKRSTVQSRIESPRNDSPIKLSNYDTKSKKVIVETTELGRELNVDATNLSRVGAKIADTPNRTEQDDNNPNAVITEVDFDKFVRRNSTHRYEDCIAVELQNEKPNIVHRIIESDLQDTTKLQTETRVPNNILIPNDVNKQGKLNSVQNITQNSSFSVKCAKKVYPGRKSNLIEESGRVQGTTVDKNIAANSLLYSQLNQNTSGVHKMTHPNKFQKAYQSALTTKIKNNLNHLSASMEQPNTVVIADPTTEDLISAVSGAKLSSHQPNKQGDTDAKETITKFITQTDNESIKESNSGNTQLESNPPRLDDDKIGSVQRQKIKQPRKQVLSPVETSDIEIIFSNSGTNDSSKGNKQRKRKTDYPLPKLLPEVSPDKAPKEDDKLSNILPKKKILARASAFSENSIERDVSSNKLSSETEKTDGTDSNAPKKARGRPRKSIIPIASNNEHLKDKTTEIESNISGNLINEDGIVTDGNTIRENWTMGKINENMRCPICSKIFRSENVVFKHVKHCSGISLEKEDGEIDDNVYHDEYMTEQPAAIKNVTITSENRDKHEVCQKDNGNEETSIEYDNKILVNRDVLKKPKSKLEKITAYAKSLKLPSHDNNVNLSCEMCGKTFRQLSYLISHKLTHTENEVKSEPVRTESGTTSALSCEICKKSFRKLYHLVQHREMHHTPKTVFEKQSKHDDVKSELMMTEKKDIIITTPPDALNAEEKSVKISQEQKTVGFRCEACDKSFRKLHHLVEHRETHDGAGRLNMPLSPLATGLNLPLPKCDICSKTFRKLHLMIEHKKQHSIMSEDENSESATDNLPRLLAKDIIHECSICYMVFPNEHSLNKHSASCLKKRNSKGVRLSTDNASVSDSEQNDSDGEKNLSENLIPVRSSPVKRSISNDNPNANQPVVPKKIHKPTGNLSQLTPKIDVKKSRISRRLNSNPPPTAKDNQEEVKDDEIRYKINPFYKPKSELDSDDRSTSGDSDNVPLKNIPKMPLVNTSRRRTLPTKKILGKVELISKETGTKQTPKLKLTHGLIIKRTPKISKHKEKKILSTVSSIINRIKSVDSNVDDDSIKYSFPKKLKSPTTIKNNETKKLPVDSNASSSTVRSQLRKLKTPTKTKKDKRESLSGVKKVKTVSKAAPFKLTLKCCGQTFSSQVTLAEHRKDHKKLPLRLTHLCDCGEVFSSAALLARHTTLSHTPPRIRRSRLFSEVRVVKGPKQNVKAKESAGAAIKSVKKKVAHTGVPLPESARRALVSDKL